MRGFDKLSLTLHKTISIRVVTLVILSLSKDWFVTRCFDKLSMTMINGSANKKILAKSGTTITEEHGTMLFK